MPFVRFLVGLLVLAVLPLRSSVAAERMLPWLDEVRVGGASLGTGEVQALFSPLVATAPAYDPNWAWLLTPRPFVGVAVSLVGKTNEAYAGFAWQVPIASRYFVELTAGGLVHDQDLNRTYGDRPSPLTTRFLFRESIGVGYEINSLWRILVFADHGSNGDLGYGNKSINRFGLLLGTKLAPATKIPERPPADTVAGFNWAGPYAGFGVGLARGNYGFVSPAFSAVTGRNDSANFAIQGGYNWSVGPLVVGLESDYSIQHMVGSATSIATNSEFSDSSFWLVTTRARVGTDIPIPYISGRSLFYGTAGAAFSRIANSYCAKSLTTCYINGGVVGGWSVQAAVKSGWTVGGGVELPVSPNVTAKFEYLYVDFGDLSYNNGIVANQITFNESILRAGMNFKFNPL